MRYRAVSSWRWWWQSPTSHGGYGHLALLGTQESRRAEPPLAAMYLLRQLHVTETGWGQGRPSREQSDGHPEESGGGLLLLHSFHQKCSLSKYYEPGTVLHGKNA